MYKEKEKEIQKVLKHNTSIIHIFKEKSLYLNLISSIIFTF